MRKIGKVTYGTEAPAPGQADKIRFVDVDQKVCIGCQHCEDICPTGSIVGVEPNKRWVPHHIPHPETCIYCGQCLINCPVNAIYERVSFIDAVNKAIADPGIVTVAMPAPSIRYALGEEFGIPEGTYVGGKMFAALKKLGFDILWDVEFGADVTIMEEGTELIGRVTGKLDRPLPQFTSCCPGWIRYVETFYPELIPHLSSTKTPTQINGVLAKTYGAEKMGADPKRMFTVAIMPCVSKKFEGLRIENQASGNRDIDATIDTRELSYMIKEAGIDFKNLPDDGKPDDLLGLSTGAGTIFAATGGVMEAMLRYVTEELSGQKLDSVDFAQVRGQKHIREASLTVGGKTVKVAVVNGLKNAREICEQVKAGTSGYTAIEVMTCPGGCINGGGQPYADWTKRAAYSWLIDLRSKLAALGKDFERA
ncbi:[FeFe] hydrogenase, group A [bacterium]|nr:[FeFe] hydrogenase, group A [bacterium]